MSTMAESYLLGHDGNVQKFVRDLSQNQTIGAAFFDALSEKDQKKLTDKGHDIRKIMHGPALLPIINYLLGPKAMTYDSLYHDIQKILPRATFSTDNYGQLIIYTDMMFAEDNRTLTELVIPEDESP